MPGESTYLENAFLNTLRGVAFSATTLYVSLHTGAPSGTGASEVPAGVYSRVGITFAAPASGSMASTATVTFNVPGSTTVAYVGLWDAPSGGNFLTGSTALTPAVVFAQQGNLNLTSLTFNQTQ